MADARERSWAAMKGAGDGVSSMMPSSSEAGGVILYPGMGEATATAPCDAGRDPRFLAPSPLRAVFPCAFAVFLLASLNAAPKTRLRACCFATESPVRGTVKCDRESHTAHRRTLTRAHAFCKPVSEPSQLSPLSPRAPKKTARAPAVFCVSTLPRSAVAPCTRADALASALARDPPERGTAGCPRPPVPVVRGCSRCCSGSVPRVLRGVLPCGTREVSERSRQAVSEC